MNPTCQADLEHTVSLQAARDGANDAQPRAGFDGRDGARPMLRGRFLPFIDNGGWTSPRLVASAQKSRPARAW